MGISGKQKKMDQPRSKRGPSFFFSLQMVTQQQNSNNNTDNAGASEDSLLRVVQRSLTSRMNSNSKAVRSTLLMDIFTGFSLLQALILYVLSSSRHAFVFPLMFSAVAYANRNYMQNADQRSPESSFFELCCIFILLIPAFSF